MTNTRILALCFTCVHLAGYESAAVPELFSEGVISTSGAIGITFTPDGRTAYIGKLDTAQKRWTIVESRSEHGEWSPPSLVDFSRQHHDAGPALSPDGRRLFFWSLRPKDGVAAKESRLWVVDRSEKGWGEARDLGLPVNRPGRPSANASVSAAGVLYFVTKHDDAFGFDDVYCARPRTDGTYERIENLGAAVNSPQHELDVYVAPDESYLLFSSNRPGGQGQTDIYISTRDRGGWTPARALALHVNTAEKELSPSVSPDGRFLFFTRLGGPTPGIYRVDAAAAGITRPASKQR